MQVEDNEHPRYPFHEQDIQPPHNRTEKRLAEIVAFTLFMVCILAFLVLFIVTGQ